MDRRGVLGFPLRLGIAFLIIALFVPSLVSAVQGFQEESDMMDAEREADRVMGAAERVWYTGAGSSESVSVHTPAGSCIRIGGEGPEAWSYSVMKGDEVKETRYSESPKIRFIGDTIMLSGSSEVVLICDTDDDGIYGIRAVPS